MSRSQNVDIYIFTPISEPRGPATTNDNYHSANTFNLAVEGTFDDCQDIVKATVCRWDVSPSVNMSAVNSINWARIMAQIVYYFFAALHLGSPDRGGFFCANWQFWQCFCRLCRQKNGITHHHDRCLNSNDILTRFLKVGQHKLKAFRQHFRHLGCSISSSKLWTVIWLNGSKWPQNSDSNGIFSPVGNIASLIAKWQKAHFSVAFRCRMRRALPDETLCKETGETIEPHSIIGVVAAENKAKQQKNACDRYATAHPPSFLMPSSRRWEWSPTRILQIFMHVKNTIKLLPMTCRPLKKLILTQVLNP